MKNRYAVDNTNRLAIRQKRKRLVADGHFATDKDNRLIYWLNEPRNWRRLYKLPPKVTFEGNWQLNPNYDLELKLAETKEHAGGDSLVIKGTIISVDRDTLVFETKSADKKGLLHVRLLKLSGSWQANESNRINFIVGKKNEPDTLVLEGSWQLNRNQQIVYHYEKIALKTKTKNPYTLTFQGSWQIDSVNQLTYILSRSSKSRFNFRAQIESPNLYPKAGAIKYRVGIGLREEKNFQAKIISFYGAWKFSKKAGLLFVMDYGEGKVQSLEFGANVYLTEKDEAVFSLLNKRNEPLGIYLTFTHKFLKELDAELFLRLKKFREETVIEAGMRIPF